MPVSPLFIPYWKALLIQVLAAGSWQASSGFEQEHAMPHPDILELKM